MVGGVQALVSLVRVLNGVWQHCQQVELSQETQVS